MIQTYFRVLAGQTDYLPDTKVTSSPLAEMSFVVIVAVVSKYTAYRLTEFSSSQQLTATYIVSLRIVFMKE